MEECVVCGEEILTHGEGGVKLYASAFDSGDWYCAKHADDAQSRVSWTEVIEANL